MVDSGYNDKTAGREDGLLKVRYANRNKTHIFPIYLKQCRGALVHSRRTFQVRNEQPSQLEAAATLPFAGSSVLREAEFEEPRTACCAKQFFDRDRTLCYDHFSVVRLWKPMLRKTVIGVSFLAFVGLGIISLSDCSIPRLEVFRTALFKSQGLMLKAICFSSANVADKFSGICWRHVPCSWNFIHGKIRIEILQPTTCSAPSRSLSPTEPQTAGEDFQVRIVVDPS